jgi:seryl-tRNA synthetase
MIDIKALEKNEAHPFLKMGYCEAYKETLKNRKSDPQLVDQLLTLNKERKGLLTEMENAKSKQNKVSGDIAKMKKAGQDASALLKDMQDLSASVQKMAEQAREAELRVETLLLTLPNILHHSTPVGSGAEDNKTVRTVGDKKSFSFKPKEHNDLGEALDIIDFDRGGKVSGARFTFLKGAAARLERALIQFMMDVHADKHGYEEMIPPFIVNAKSMLGTGQFPKFRDDVFWITNPEYYLIPTAEVPVTNYFGDEILDSKILPKCFTAYSPCFRSEAGSYGKDTKGLIRQHQFNKIELVKFTRPEESEEEHEKLTANAEEILKLLDLHFKTVALCSGDIGFGATKCYDIEVWLPGQNAYREISSCSNFGDFQARRANIRFRDAGGKPQFVHTINGSGLAVGRTLIAILENYQQEDGSINIPKVLRPYMGGLDRIVKK